LQRLAVKQKDNLFCYRAPLLQALIGLFVLPRDESSLPDDHYIEVDDTPGYQAAYSQLAFANKKDHDPLHGIHPSLDS
jgi:exportin-2 (importin alpha re-exporter)